MNFLDVANDLGSGDRIFQHEYLPIIPIIRWYRDAPFWKAFGMYPFCAKSLRVSCTLRNAVYWVIMQRVVVISHRHIGTTYLSHFKGLGFLTLEKGTDRVPRKFGKELPLLAA
jgi:hypothetical protein